jgi:hypothetical protein
MLAVSSTYFPGASNLHVPSQPLAAGAGLTGTPEQVGAAPFHVMFAAKPVLSANVMTPPAAIVTRAGAGLAPGAVQHCQFV